MIASTEIKIPEKNIWPKEKLLLKRKFKLKYLSDFFEIIIGKTKNYILLKSSYYELKLDIENSTILTNTIFKSIDDLFEFLENIFNQNKSYIKEICPKEMKLVIKSYDVIKGKEKEIELVLMINYDDKNNIIKELFNKYIKMGKEINELINDKNMKKESDKLLNEKIINLEKEINSMKINQKNEKEELQNEMKKISDKNISLEKEISSLKDFHNKEKEEFAKKINNIIDKNISLKKEINSMKDRHNNMKEELEKKINNIIDKNISLEKEINSLKNNHNNGKEELEIIIKNISDKNINLEKDISSMKDKNNNEKEELQNKMKNISDVIEQIQQKMNELNNVIENLNLMENKNNFIEMTTYPMNFNLNALPLNFMNQMDENINLMNQMNQDINLINRMNENKNESFEKSKELAIIFRKSNTDPVSIICKSNEKVSEIIKRFREKINYFKEDIIFSFNAKKLNKDLTIDEAGLMNNSNVFVNQQQCLKID